MADRALSRIHPEETPGTISYAAEHGTHRELLVAIRDHMAHRIDAGVPARELSSLCRQIRYVVRDIHTIDDGGTFE